MKNINKTYDPTQVEDRLYKKWTDNGYFKADETSDKPPFSMVIPPPNVTGQLHMGHALDETLQDIIVRFKRMQGFDALWVPGTDHAGIATQIKVEEQLRTEGLTRHDLGREKFLERVWDWKNNYGDRIINQLKKLGSSCDWSRERFTMDEGCSRAVLEVFVKLYEKGLIYKGNRIINWCPSCTTALSDAEVEHSEQEGNLWHISYPLKDGTGIVTIATTRPETMLGDTAVAVNPMDKRYAEMIGKILILPLVNREIPIIADDYVEMEFGTGAVKITPAHDPNDFEVGARHNLEQVKMLNDDGTINALGGKYQGLDRYEARKRIVEDLKSGGYLVKTEAHSHNVGECYRCSTTVEPITSEQWFVKMEPLAKKAIDVVKDEIIKFVPERFSKIYLNWMENVHDWCISRQLWWGHRIPAYYCTDCNDMVVSRETQTECKKCGGRMTQDEDVLDTWFSSALWPFSTMGWPDETEDLKRYYPTSVLVTGYDIIFFWVARMIFSGMEHMGREPFEHVFIHGLVRDSDGRKMSKSLGNGIDPLEIIKLYGADALRFTLATGNSPGNDMRFYTERVEASRNFANKLWNAARFVLMNLSIDKVELPDDPCLEDKWILSKYNSLVKDVTENLERFEIGIAAGAVYDFIWDIYCDWYIELVKPRLYDTENTTNAEAQKTLAYVLTGVLKLLHPFMPFITEEIFCALPVSDESIVISDLPKYSESLSFEEEELKMEIIREAIRGVRNIRVEMNIPPSKKASLIIVTEDTKLFSSSEAFFKKLAAASEVLVVDTKEGTPKNVVTVIVQRAEILIPRDELIDKDRELERLQKEKAMIEGEIKRCTDKLSNPGFLEKAPERLVEEERAKALKYKDMLEKVLLGIEALV